MTTGENSESSVSALGRDVLRFLGSLGQRSEAELYLRIFQTLPPEEFAILVPSRAVLHEQAGTLAEQIRFLRDLGLCPTVVLDALDPSDDGAAAHFYSALLEAGLEARELNLSASAELSKAELAVSLGESQILVVRHQKGERDRLVELAGLLTPHKTLFLRMSGGLGPDLRGPVELGPGHFLHLGGSGIASINLRGDARDLIRADVLRPEERELFERACAILDGPTGDRPRATVSFASPLSIIRELFTVTGEGTLVKRGATIATFDGWAGVDQGKVRELLDASFGRTIKDEFFSRTPLRVHLEDEYRGMALVEEGKHAAFLSKFAVMPVARGEGLGQDLWWSLWKTAPALYWRSRPDNPISSWYRTVCDGMHREGDWNVYWRGVDAEKLPALIRDAVERPRDFSD